MIMYIRETEANRYHRNDSKLIKAAHHNFALITIINEIVCGKTTPLTLKEAHELPEWET